MLCALVNYIRHSKNASGSCSADSRAGQRCFKRRQGMFLGNRTCAVVSFSHRDAECSLAKSRPNQNSRTISWQFNATFRLGDAQFPIGLNSRQAFRPNSRSFSNVQVVYSVTKIRFSPVTRLRNPFITRKERRVNDDNTANLQNSLLRRRLDLRPNLLKSRMHLFK